MGFKIDTVSKWHHNMSFHKEISIKMFKIVLRFARKYTCTDQTYGAVNVINCTPLQCRLYFCYTVYGLMINWIYVSLL